MAPRRRMRRQASRPSAKEAKPKARRPSPSGTGWTRNRPSVMTPRVPSLPTNSWVRSGPVADRGPYPPVRTTRPSARTTSSPMHHVLDLPVPVGVLAGAPAGQPAAHGGQVHGLGPVPERDTVTVPEPGLHVGAEGPGPKVGDERVRRRPSPMPARPHRSRATPPNSGTDAPHTPLRPPGRGDRHPGLVAEGQDRGHLAGVGGAGHHRRPGRHLRRPRPSRWPAATSPVRPRPGPRPGPRSRRRRPTAARGGASSTATRSSAEVVGHLVRMGVDRRSPAWVGSPGLPAATGGRPGVPAGPGRGPGSRPAWASSGGAGPRRSPRLRLRCARRPNRVRGRSARPPGRAAAAAARASRSEARVRRSRTSLTDPAISWRTA